MKNKSITVLENSINHIISKVWGSSDYDINMNNSEKIELIIECIKQEFIYNKDKIVLSAEDILMNKEELIDLTTRICNTIFLYYKHRNIKIKSESKCRLVLLSLINQFCYELSLIEKNIFQKLLIEEEEYYCTVYELLKLMLSKFYCNLKDEHILASFFQDYS